MNQKQSTPRSLGTSQVETRSAQPHARSGRQSSPRSQPALSNHRLQTGVPRGILQRKLAIGSPNDQFEQEANRVADQVMGSARTESTDLASVTRSAGNGVQRKCACGGNAGASGECEECKKKRLQRLSRSSVDAGQSPASAPPIVHEVLSSPGRPLEAATRAFMEPRFGYDFSEVRVHDDPRAAASARSVNALAYTVGSDVVFDAGRYSPETREGARLLAHELTHVAQQSGARAPLAVQRLGPDAGGQQSHSSTLPYHEATELAACIRIMGSENAAYCRQQVLGEQPDAPAALAPGELTVQQVADAITFNEQRFHDPFSIRMIRQVVGIDSSEGIIDEDFVRAVGRWQFAHHLTVDGQVGHDSTRLVFTELVRLGQRVNAVALLIDSYALQGTAHLFDLQVGVGPNCCAGGTADAVTFGGVCPPVGGGVRVCVCQTSFPPANDYNHFVRIVAHELVHVPHCAGAALDLHATEFDAFAFEACGEGRFARLTAAQRINHANIALAHFALLGAVAQTPARIAMRDRLNRLIVAGGVGVCV